MDNLINVCEDYTAAYLDDEVIYSNTWKEHLKHLATVLSRVRTAGLTV